MSETTQTGDTRPSQASKEDKKKEAEFTMQIKQHDEIKLLLKKLAILKQGVLTERRRKRELEGQLQQSKSNIAKYQEENKRKEKKHEDLTAQIKKLKDELIEQRNLKHKIYEELKEKQQGIRRQAPSQQNNANLGLFGLRGMFV